MATRAQAIKWARDQIGETDGGKYWLLGFGFYWTADWCAAFCSAYAKVNKVKTVYFPNKFAFDKRNLDVIGDAWREPYDGDVGDFISFDFDGGGQWGGDHVGVVVEKVARGDYWTVEGNCGKRVQLKHRTVANDGIIGFIRPEYDDDVFPDVDSSTPHFEDIKWMKDSKITTGFIDGTFRPTSNVARADMAAFLHRLAGTPIFKDVNAKTSHAEDIWWMAAKGLSTGYPDGTYRPSNSVTRADMAAFLCRFVNGSMYVYEPTQSDIERFSDVDWQTPHCREVWWMAHMGISTGFSDGTFRPDATLKRCDAAAFLHRVNGLAGV